MHEDPDLTLSDAIENLQAEGLLAEEEPNAQLP
jgi:hypothetical protein